MNLPVRVNRMKTKPIYTKVEMKFPLRILHTTVYGKNFWKRRKLKMFPKKQKNLPQLVFIKNVTFPKNGT